MMAEDYLLVRVNCSDKVVKVERLDKIVSPPFRKTLGCSTLIVTNSKRGLQKPNFSTISTICSNLNSSTP